MVCFFTEDEKCDLMVGFDVIDAVDEGRDKFKDEHDIVSFVEI